MKAALFNLLKLVGIAIVLIISVLAIGVCLTYPIMVVVATKSLWFFLLYLTFPYVIPTMLLIVAFAEGMVKLITNKY